MSNNIVTGLAALDNTVLINFSIIRRSDLVLSLWANTCTTTDYVINEYNTGVKKGLLVEDFWISLPIMKMNDAEQKFFNALPPKLGKGECSCLAITIHRQGIFVSDDLYARNFAMQNGVSIIGTIDILIAHIHRNTLSLLEGNHLLKNMMDAGYRSPMSSLDGLIRH